ncbi:hypothetical protein ACFZAU_37455 [Streptomyces sp. NPDC008238]
MELLVNPISILIFGSVLSVCVAEAVWIIYAHGGEPWRDCLKIFGKVLAGCMVVVLGAAGVKVATTTPPTRTETGAHELVEPSAGIHA